MTRRRLPAFWTVAACLILTLGGSGLQPAAAQETVELRIWDQFTDPVSSDAVDAIYAAFTEANPNIEIVREVFATDQMRETVNTAIASGTGPDLIAYDAGPGYAGVLADAGLLQPLDSFADDYGWHDRIAAQSMEATTIGGTLYGLPLTVDLIGMFYNQTLMEQEGFSVPQTFDDLLAFCGEASDVGYIPLAFTDNPGWQGFHQFSMATNNMLGPDAVNALLKNNEGSWDSPEVVAGMQQYFVDMRDAGCFSEDVNALTNDDANAMFQSGQALMWPTGSWMVREFNPDTMPDMDVQMMPFPALDGAQGSYWVSGVGSAYYISAASQNHDAAAQFLDYLFSPDVAPQWVQDAGFFVPMSVDTASMDVSPLAQTVLEQLDMATAGEIELGYNIDVMAPARFNETLQNGIQSILAGDMTPEELATELQAVWEESYVATPMASPAS